MRLRDKVALVTGSARGIGRAIVERFAEEGAVVVVSDVASAEDAARETLSAVEAKGGKGLVAPCDVTDSAQVDRAVSETVAAFGRIDVLVNNAGITRDNLMMRMTEDDFDLVLRVHLKGTFLLTKAVSRVMMKQRYGRIVNMSSVVGVMGNAGQANYSAAKAGIIGLTKSTAKELAARNITANAIAPGFIRTAMTDALTDAVRNDYLSKIPFGRFAEAREVADLALFLASDEASYITGQVVGINGGLYI
jgi:3-oxoacyl-[acyl-carrier protein] reductase